MAGECFAIGHGFAIEYRSPNSPMSAPTPAAKSSSSDAHDRAGLSRPCAVEQRDQAVLEQVDEIADGRIAWWRLR
jgi:hypothetical protein